MNGSVNALLGSVVSAVLVFTSQTAFSAEQTNSVCSPVPTEIPYLKEVALESLQTEGRPAYELEWAEIQVESRLADGQTASAAVSLRPTSKGFASTLHCQTKPDATTSALEAVLSSPLSIDASNLSLSGWVDAGINVIDRAVPGSDVPVADPDVHIKLSPTSKTSTLTALKAALTTEGEVRLYKTGENRIELRATRTIGTDQKRMKIFTRHVFGMRAPRTS